MINIAVSDYSQTQFPTVEKAIITHLNQLRDASVPLTLVTIRGIVVALIMQLAPEIFEIKAADGSEFQCSDSFIRQWLHTTLNWSEWKSTRCPIT